MSVGFLGCDGSALTQGTHDRTVARWSGLSQAIRVAAFKASAYRRGMAVIESVHVDGREVEGCRGAMVGPGTVLRLEDITITFGPGSVVAGDVFGAELEKARALIHRPLCGRLDGRPGKPRPGQWGARARMRRARRWRRAQERRYGLSLRMLKEARF